MNNSNINYSQKVVEMKNITKKFGSFVANDNINLTVHKGEVHALLGENGFRRPGQMSADAPACRRERASTRLKRFRAAKTVTRRELFREVGRRTQR